MSSSPGVEALFIRLYFDRHIMKRLVVDLRGRCFDVITTEEASKDTASDEEQLAFATAEGRAILTFSISAILRRCTINGQVLAPLAPESLFPSSSAAANIVCCSNAC